VTATRKAVATPMPRASATVSGGRGRKTRNRRQRREFGRSRNSRVGPLFVRKGSTTSQESQLGAQVSHIVENAHMHFTCPFQIRVSRFVVLGF
jgi:hypothetical protein